MCANNLDLCEHTGVRTRDRCENTRVRARARGCTRAHTRPYTQAPHKLHTRAHARRRAYAHARRRAYAHTITRARWSLHNGTAPLRESDRVCVCVCGRACVRACSGVRVHVCMRTDVRVYAYGVCTTLISQEVAQQLTPTQSMVHTYTFTCIHMYGSSPRRKGRLANIAHVRSSSPATAVPPPAPRRTGLLRRFFLALGLRPFQPL